MILTAFCAISSSTTLVLGIVGDIGLGEKGQGLIKVLHILLDMPPTISSISGAGETRCRLKVGVSYMEMTVWSC